MKHEIIDGIYYRDGKPVFALGVSYYPSFHKGKYQVPPEGDRIGEMKLDFEDIKKYGFNYVRTAALGDVYLDKSDDSVAVHTDFIDEMAREADRNDLGLSIRLQGYIMNLRDNKDYLMLNNFGDEMDRIWYVFMRANFFHEGINKDNHDATYALAKHYEQFNSVISYQIYNEPHYAENGMFDYHPLTIQAYKKSLVERGIMTQSEADNYTVPSRRPETKEGLRLWADWRSFNRRAMCNYLNQSAAASKEASDKDTYTCYTTCEITSKAVNCGTTFFDDANFLSTVGMTIYTSFDGSDYFNASEVLCMCESAAALAGKKAWVVELDTRVNIPLSKFLIENYAVVGAGFKGINYYEWRGDYPAKDSPLPDNCGFIHTDRTPTDFFDEKMKMISLINSLSDELVFAERVRSGVAILYSDDAIAYCDGAADPMVGGNNKYLLRLHTIYKELRKAGISPDFVRSGDLEENIFGVKYLFVPVIEALDDDERAKTEEFMKKGNKVFKFGVEELMGGTDYDGYRDLSVQVPEMYTKAFNGAYELDDVIELYGITPMIEVYDRNMFYDVLENEDSYIISLINTSPVNRVIPAGTIRLNGLKDISSAVMYTTEETAELQVTEQSIEIKPLKYGAFIRVMKA